MGLIFVTLDAYREADDLQLARPTYLIWINAANLGTMERITRDPQDWKSGVPLSYTKVMYAVGSSCCRADVKQTPEEILALIKKETDTRIPGYLIASAPSGRAP